MGVLSGCFLLFVFLRTNAVPPEACFANFRWDDCGKSPVPVMYYWKPGSRCEVGLWRGCLPSLNMFQDEYECVTTCIFTARAMPEDYHSMNENTIDDIDVATEIVTEVANVSETTSFFTTVVDVSSSQTDGNATTAGTQVTTASGDAAPTTLAPA